MSHHATGRLNKHPEVQEVIADKVGETMNAWNLSTGDLTAGCCTPIKSSNEHTTSAVIEPSGSYLSGGKT